MPKDPPKEPPRDPRDLPNPADYETVHCACGRWYTKLKSQPDVCPH